MEKADGIVKKYFKDLKYFKATWLVKVTWENMTLYGHKEQVNILFAKGLRSSLIIVTTKKRGYHSQSFTTVWFIFRSEYLNFKGCFKRIYNLN